MDTQDKAQLSLALRHAIDSTRSFVDKEKARILDKLQKDYGDKFFTEGMDEYIRRRDELDEMFSEQFDKIQIEINPRDGE